MRTIELKRMVRWTDADAAGRIYYPKVFDYAGDCEWELLRSIGITRKQSGNPYDFPRVHAECRFKKTLELGASFIIRFRVDKLGRTSIRYGFEIFLEKEPDDVAASGSVTVVVLADGKPTAIPPHIRSALEGQ
jgi:acyl-CoA thioester hydrolase